MQYECLRRHPRPTLEHKLLSFPQTSDSMGCTHSMGDIHRLSTNKSKEKKKANVRGVKPQRLQERSGAGGTGWVTMGGRTVPSEAAKTSLLIHNVFGCGNTGEQETMVS